MFASVLFESEVRSEVAANACELRIRDTGVSLIDLRGRGKAEPTALRHRGNATPALHPQPLGHAHPFG
jgi:hypothetical protein